jgi:N,N'-diacetyllegionaminate synthase
MSATIEIAGRKVGAGEPVLVVAEAGVNHNGSLERALRLVDAAAAAGADAVKFQTFDAKRLAAAGAPLSSYQRSGTDAESQVAMLEKLELPREAFAELSRRSAERKLLFLSTPFDEASAELLEELDVPAFKVGSGDLTNIPFLRSLAARGRPILLSTGMATLEEVAEAVEAVRAGGDPGLALLHCVSSYPVPPDQANLLAIDTLRREFELPIGYSDHTLGLEVALAAVARGAVIVEKHYTLDRRLHGPDHALSLEPSELDELVTGIRRVEVAMGDGVKRPQPAEKENLVAVRRSLVAARDLAAGERVAAEDIAIKRPAGGLTPSRLDELVGVELARPIRAEEPFTEKHLP